MTRAEQRRAARLDAKDEQYLASGLYAYNPIMHGVCRRCGRRTYLVRPAAVCNKRCVRELVGLRWAVGFLGGEL